MDRINRIRSEEEENPVHPVYPCKTKQEIEVKNVDKQNRKKLYEKLTHSIIGCAFEVVNELGSGFLESVYEKAMMIALSDAGLAVQSQKPIETRFRGKSVGDFYADLFVEGKVLVELKAVKALAPEHQAQIINYLNASGVEVGLLINFGNPKLEFKRFTRNEA